DARERRARVEIEEAEVRTRLDAAGEGCRRELECEPEVALAAPAPVCPEGTTLAARGKEIERELRQMGAINPLALEEYEAQKERYTLLESQLEDVKAARRDLARIIKQVNEEIATLFAAAYEDTERHFEALIATLFPGGTGRLRLTDPEDPLNTGIEIEARPSGKSVRRLSLLSGGERSLTALAFLFAVFRARPTPFYILDEVEAALDDVNLCRFVDLIHEFRYEVQLLVVSHQKRTMEAADCLYGVSMPPGGSSIVVTQRVPSAEPAVVGAMPAITRRPPRSRRAARVLIVVLALVWTQFPFGSGGASAEGDHELALCCAWGKSLEHGNLTYSILSPDAASAEVIRQAVREWDADLPALTLSEVPVGSPADLAIRFIPVEGR